MVSAWGKRKREGGKGVTRHTQHGLPAQPRELGQTRQAVKTTIFPRGKPSTRSHIKHILQIPKSHMAPAPPHLYQSITKRNSGVTQHNRKTALCVVHSQYS